MTPFTIVRIAVHVQQNTQLKEKFPELTVRGKNIFQDIQVLATNEFVPKLPSDKRKEIEHLLEKIFTLQNEVLLLNPTSKQSVFNYKLCVYHLNEYIDSVIIDTEKLISNSAKPSKN